jgi:hypothetical protein
MKSTLVMATRTPLLVIRGDNDISTAVDNWFALTRKITNAHLSQRFALAE